MRMTGPKTSGRNRAGTAERRAAERRGHGAERWAAWALRLKGYRILAVRHRTKLGEIDVIARRGDLVAIVEVKARPTLEAAMEAVDARSQRRIAAAADLWLTHRPDHARISLRFDIVAVLPRRWPVHVPDAWRER